MPGLQESQTNTAGRVQALRAKMEQVNFDGFLVSHFANRRYLSGYIAGDIPPNETSGFLLITRQAAFLITSFNFAELARQQALDYEVVVFGNGVGFSRKIAQLITEQGLKRVGFEAIALIFDFYLNISQALEGKAELVPAKGFVEALRAVKEAEELAILREAVRLADQVFNEVAGLVQPGVTERQIAWEIERRIREYGGEGVAFETIVAGGPNGAVPHATVSERAFEPGDPVIIDMGARYQGYNSDLTRTLWVVEPTPRYKEIYNIVLEAELKAIKAIRPGLRAEEADVIARDFISSYGYGENFGHSLGHGIGLAAHEPPSLRKGSKDVLAPNMVHSVEPGIYLNGWGGVRIEDLVSVTAEGHEVLTKADKSEFW